MVDASEATRRDASLPAPLQAAIDRFKAWVVEYLKGEEGENKIDVPLYHYTDGRGLKGIFESGRIWFTDYRHLNDPSEVLQGIDTAHYVALHLQRSADGRARLFLDTFIDMFRHKNIEATLQFYIASFSRARNDLAQWRAYADNGQGFAIGFSPHMFSLVENLPTDRPPEFVGAVRYTLEDVFTRYQPPILEAAAIFLDTVVGNDDLVRDRTIGKSFMEELARELIASPIIWRSLTTKHPAYEHEREVRLVIMGTPARLSPYVTTRLRGGEIVPFIPQPMAVRERDNIVEIVVGPAAPVDTERTLRTFLNSLGIDPDIHISRSDIPYRVL
jgi:hypothetical protein